MLAEMTFGSTPLGSWVLMRLIAWLIFCSAVPPHLLSLPLSRAAAAEVPAPMAPRSPPFPASAAASSSRRFGELIEAKQLLEQVR